jgi:hypothetical protein
MSGVMLLQTRDWNAFKRGPYGVDIEMGINTIALNDRVWKRAQLIQWKAFT